MHAGTIDESFYGQILGLGGGSSHFMGSMMHSMEITSGYDPELDISYGGTSQGYDTVFDERP
jgi:hypothetical protein